jgi:hypothetical protein
MKKVAVGQVGMSGTPTFVTSVTIATIATFIHGWRRGTTSTGEGVYVPPVEDTAGGYRGLYLYGGKRDCLPYPLFVNSSRRL